MIKKNRPTVWLGQSVDTSSLCSSYPKLRQASFLTSLGCAIRRPSLKDTHLNENLREKLGITGPIMVDSGGFVLMKNPSASWTLKKVATLIQKIDANIFVSLDLPPAARDTCADRIVKIRKSIRNFRALTEQFPTKIIMPVVHGRTLMEVETSIELICKSSKQPEWIGLGGIVPLLLNRRVSKGISKDGSEVFIAHALSMIRKAFPSAKVHAFGAGGTRTFPAVFALGADSGDSIAWRQAAGFGSIFLPFKSQRVVKWKGDSPPRKLLDESDLEQISLCGCPICSEAGPLRFRIFALQRNFHNRSIHNAWTLSNQYSSWPNARADMKLLVSRGALGKRWAKAIDSVES